MSNSISSPLQSLIEQASRQDSGGDVSRLRRRQTEAGHAIIMLADVSDSMRELAGIKRKVDVLREALAVVWPEATNARLIAFSAVPTFIAEPSDLPEPSGSTALHLALDAAASLRPRQTVVISDGRPDSEDAALRSAERLTGRIDVIYCGPESDLQAISFLQRLARSTGGHCTVVPQSALQLVAPIRRLLGTGGAQ